MSASGPLIVVEDNLDDLYFLKRALGSVADAPELLTCRDGIDAIELLLRLKEKGEKMPSAIVTDLKMPMKSGFDLLQWRREHDWARAIPMVVLSSSGLETDQDHARALGATAYYVKPDNGSGLINTLGAILQEHCAGKRDFEDI
jgi:CheY-like chemotaxis protein